MFTIFQPGRLWRRTASIVQSVLIAVLLFAPLAQAQRLQQPHQVVQYHVLYDEHWPFNAVPQTVAEKAMGPQSGNVLAVWNNRPFRYETKPYDDVSLMEKAFDGDILKIAEFRDPATSYRLTELLLLRSLKHAERVRSVWDVIGCHASLGMLYYQKADYLHSEYHWREAARLAEGREGNGLRLAAAYEFLGQALRAQGKFEPAEDAYRRALAIRMLAHGTNNHITAAGHMNLAMLYNDWGRVEFEEHATANAFDILGPTAFFNSWLTQGARPTSTFMPAKTTIAGELPDMVSFAWSVLRKPEPGSRMVASAGRRPGVAMRTRPAM